MCDGALLLALYRRLCQLVVALCPRILASATIASVVALTPFLWVPAELVASVLSGYFESGNDGMEHGVKMALREVAIVKITRPHFQKMYGTRSPLDRCALARDLEQLFELSGLKVVAVALDLAPYLGPNNESDGCQERLNTVVDRYARSHTLILMEPKVHPDDDPDLKNLIKTWQQVRTTNGVRFAHTELTPSCGVTRAFTPTRDGKHAIGLAFREKLLGDAALGTNEQESDLRQIAVRGTEALYKMGSAIPLDKICDEADGYRIRCRDITAAIVGSGYSPEDHHNTVNGPREAVDLLAAIAACPKAGTSHLVHFLLDVVLGVFLGWVFGRQWRCYYETVAEDRLKKWAEWKKQPVKGLAARLYWCATPRNPCAAYGWIGWMFLFAMVMLVAVSLGSLLIFGGPCATAIFPVGIVVGMFIEAAIIQGHEMATHYIIGGSDNSSVCECDVLGRLRRMNVHSLLKTGFALALNVYTIVHLL